MNETKTGSKTGSWPVGQWIADEQAVRIAWVTGMGGMTIMPTATSQTGLTFETEGEEWFAPWTSILNLHTV